MGLATGSQLYPRLSAQTLERTRKIHVHTLDTRAPAEKKGIDCGGSLLLSNKPVSFTEGGLWLPALPGASSISVMDGCGALHRVPVNFNYIDLPPSRAEGMPALCVPLTY